MSTWVYSSNYFCPFFRVCWKETKIAIYKVKKEKKLSITNRERERVKQRDGNKKEQVKLNFKSVLIVILYTDDQLITYIKT